MSEKKVVSTLREAIDFNNRYYPLPRCLHDNALKDHAGELLEPPCGCRHPEHKDFENTDMLAITGRER